MSESTAAAMTDQDASGYWKLCTIVLGIAFMIAVASHATPSTASATDSPNALTLYQSQAAIGQHNQVLSIGGFDSIEGAAAFVIVNQSGQRVGTLPMSAMSSD